MKSRPVFGRLFRFLRSASRAVRGGVGAKAPSVTRARGSVIARFGLCLAALASGGVSVARAQAEPMPSPSPSPSASAGCALPEPSDSFVSDLRPAANGSVAANEPLIFAHVRAGIDPATLRVRIDGTDATDDAVRWTSGFLVPDAFLESGCHTVDVTATGAGGVALERSWTFASGTSSVKSALAFYEDARDGDAVASDLYLSGKAAANGTIVAVGGIAGETTGMRPGSLVTNAREVTVAAGGDGEFALDIPARIANGRRGTIAIVAIDPATGAGTLAELRDLRAATIWCPDGSAHTASKVTEFVAYAAAHNALCAGEYESAKASFAVAVPGMRARHLYDGRRWLDTARDYFYELLATHADADAERFLHTIDRGRAPSAADRAFFAERYDDAARLYAAEEKHLASSTAYDTTGSFVALQQGNAAARARRWNDAFTSWIAAAGIGHQVMEFDLLDDWNVDALQMMYAFRAHAPR